MKKVYLFGVLALFVSIAFAQTPQGMNYQAVARNFAGTILSNQIIGVRIAITNGSGGTTLYQETQTPATNPFGLFTLNIGSGTVVSGNFAAIQWDAVTPWLQVEMDPAGGTSYVLMGSSQLLSVPYALHAEKAVTSNVATNMALNDLTDVNSPAPASGQILKYNGTQWTPSLDNNTTYTQGTGIGIAGNVISNTGDVNANDDITNNAAAAGDLGGTYPNPSVNAIRGFGVSAAAPAAGQVLKFNGTQWNPAADNNAAYTQGTGINIAGNTISNTITALGNLSNVNTTGAASGLVLKYNGTNWIPSTDNTSSSSGGVNVTPRLSGSGTVGSPLDIAQQGANTGDALKWNGTAWTPGASAGSYWTANGSDISNSNSGSVGIGTNTPLSMLDVAGNIALNDNEIRLRAGNNTDHELRYDAAVDGPYLFGFNGGALGTKNLPHSLTWDFNGNVGVRSTLTVDNASSNSGTFANVLQFGASSGEGIGSNRSGSGSNLAGLDFYTSSQKRVSITDNGRIGIGTPQPFYDLHINNSSSPDAAIQFTNAVTGNTQINGSWFGQFGKNLLLHNWEHGSILFNTSGLQRGAIDSSGNFGIGTITPAAKLDVEGNVKIVDGTQGEGKVLTSDGNGLASWKGIIACSAANGGGQTTNDTLQGSATKTVVFKNELYDDGGNNYDPSTGIYTVSQSGIYQCSAVVFLTRFSGTSTSRMFLRIDKNNIYTTSSESPISDYIGLKMSIDLKLNAGDNIRFKVLNSSGDSFIIYPTDGDTRMSIRLVR